MPSREAYLAIFDALTEPILDRDADSNREAEHLGALAHQALVKAKKMFVVEITTIWKAKFGSLKAENDRMQEARGTRAAAKHGGLLAEYNAATAAITEAWNSGFAVIKAENDQMQRDLASAYKEAYAEVGARVAEIREGIEK